MLKTKRKRIEVTFKGVVIAARWSGLSILTEDHIQPSVGFREKVRKRRTVL